MRDRRCGTVNADNEAMQQVFGDLYGITRSPITLNKGQWLRILSSGAKVEAFIGENDSKLITKE